MTNFKPFFNSLITLFKCGHLSDDFRNLVIPIKEIFIKSLKRKNPKLKVHTFSQNTSTEFWWARIFLNDQIHQFMYGVSFVES